MHPTTHLVIWLMMLAASQTLVGLQLVAAFLVLQLFGISSLRRCGRLAWGMRWLFVSLFVILSWGGVGEPLGRGALAPTVAGLTDAAPHLGLALVALMAVAVLLECMPVSDLLTATHRLLGPLRASGIDPERGVVRLMLVLRYVEVMPRPRDWRILLDVPARSVDEMLEVVDRPFSWADPLAIGMAAGVVTIFCFWQA